MISDRNLEKEDLIKYKDNLVLVMPIKYYNEEIFNIYEDKYMGYSNLEEKEKINASKVFINDVSYLDKTDYQYIDYLYMIKNGKVLGEYELNTHVNKYLLSQNEVEKI